VESLFLFQRIAVLQSMLSISTGFPRLRHLTVCASRPRHSEHASIPFIRSLFDRCCLAAIVSLEPFVSQ
jgi:hypothetical protein